jgi:soluble epoxide hydrolase/lipid-phosphate phosphatase
MAQIAFPAHAHTTTLQSGNTYSYAYSAASRGSTKQTVLLLHGFPSSSHDWLYQFHHLTSHGFSVLAPDLLSYGDTSSPTDPEAYKFSRMAADLIDLMKVVGINTEDRSVHVVGHDFGSILMSYLIVKYPSLTRSCVFITVPFVPPGQKLDLDTAKILMEKQVGFEVFGYRRLLIREDASELLDAHVSEPLLESWLRINDLSGR